MKLFRIIERTVETRSVVVAAENEEEARKWEDGHARVVCWNDIDEEEMPTRVESVELALSPLPAPEGGFYPGVVYASGSKRILEWSVHEEPEDAIERAKEIWQAGAAQTLGWGRC